MEIGGIIWLQRIVEKIDAGRYLTVVFIRKFGGRALIITARDMDKKERKQYAKGN